MEWKERIMLLTSNLCLSKKVHVILKQSSIKVTNQRAPEMSGIVEGPQMSLWIKSKGLELRRLLIGNGTRLRLVNSQTSQWKSLIFKPLNKDGNIILKT